MWWEVCLAIIILMIVSYIDWLADASDYNSISREDKQLGQILQYEINSAVKPDVPMIYGTTWEIHDKPLVYILTPSQRQSFQQHMSKLDYVAMISYDSYDIISHRYGDPVTRYPWTYSNSKYFPCIYISYQEELPHDFEIASIHDLPIHYTTMSPTSFKLFNYWYDYFKPKIGLFVYK